MGRGAAKWGKEKLELFVPPPPPSMMKENFFGLPQRENKNFFDHPPPLILLIVKYQPLFGITTHLKINRELTMIGPKKEGGI